MCYYLSHLSNPQCSVSNSYPLHLSFHHDASTYPVRELIRVIWQGALTIWGLHCALTYTDFTLTSVKLPVIYTSVCERKIKFALPKILLWGKIWLMRKYFKCKVSLSSLAHNLCPPYHNKFLVIYIKIISIGPDSESFTPIGK